MLRRQVIPYSSIMSRTYESSMSGRQDPGMLRALELISLIAESVGLRMRMSASEREDLASAARIKLLENGSATLSRFEGRSSLRTYLTVVVTRIALDEHAKQNGRWRPSAEARRQGPAAEEFERLLERDGHSRHSAIETLRNHFPATTPEALSFLEKSRTPRVRIRFVPDDMAGEVPAATPDPEAVLLQEERIRSRVRVGSALAHAVAQLASDDRLVLRLKFDEGMTIGDIARALSLDQRALYRRVDALLAALRLTLRTAGIGDAEIESALAAPSWWAPTSTAQSGSKSGGAFAANG